MYTIQWHCTVCIFITFYYRPIQKELKRMTSTFSSTLAAYDYLILFRPIQQVLKKLILTFWLFEIMKPTGIISYSTWLFIPFFSGRSNNCWKSRFHLFSCTFVIISFRLIFNFSAVHCVLIHYSFQADPTSTEKVDFNFLVVRDNETYWDNIKYQA